MAQTDRADHRLTSEEKLANLVLGRMGLSPPVDVRTLATHYADVEEDLFPVPVDAVAIRRPYNHFRPLILLNRGPSIPRTRLRFTIAHEIGHIVIPFHPGWVACHVDVSEAEPHGIVGAIEQGANLFASELLMPTEWAKRIVSDEGSIRRMFDRLVEEADVSYTAARIKLTKCLPPDCICVVSDVILGITRIDSSPGTRLGSLVLGYGDRRQPAPLFERLDRNSTERCVIQRGNRQITFWRLGFSRQLPQLSDNRPSKEILRTILDEVMGNSPFREAKTSSISGKCGAWNIAEAADSVETIYGVLKARFERPDITADEKLSRVVRHPDFDAFLAMKAAEMFAKFNQKRRFGR